MAGVLLAVSVGGCADAGADPERRAVAFVEAIHDGDWVRACKMNVSEGVVSSEDAFLRSVCEARVGQMLTPVEIDQFLDADRVVDSDGSRAVVRGANTRIRVVKIGSEWFTEYHFENGRPAETG